MSHEERNYVDQIAVVITLKIWTCNGYVYGTWNGAMLFITGVNNVDGSIGKHHEIDHYEIAIGTDRRYQKREPTYGHSLTLVSMSHGRSQT